MAGLLIILSFSTYSQPLFSSIDTYLSNTHRKNKFNGTALVAVKGEIILYKGYGLRDKALGIYNDTATIFRIGSISKTFTAAMIMRLKESGLLSLEDKLITFLPDYPNGDKITIENLLTHSSGIFEYLKSKEYGNSDFNGVISRDVLIGFFKDHPLGFSPGTKFEYSNSNYILLAIVIEKITGKSYENNIREIIFEPLGMKNSGFDFLHLDDSNKATNYDNIFKKTPHTNPIFDSTQAPGCGAIYSTVMDLYRWDRVLYTNQIISKASLKKAYTPYKWVYGYGWFIDSAYGRLNVSHGGGVPGFVSKFHRFPDDDICIILLSNNAYCDLSEMTNRIAGIIFDKPYEKAVY